MTFKEYEAACGRADVAMKKNNGHLFEHILKTRCRLCGRGPNAKGKCRQWFAAFLHHLGGELTGVYGIPQAGPEATEVEEEVEKRSAGASRWA